MKKIFPFILSLAMIFAISATAFATEHTPATLSEVSEAYGIPMDVLKGLDQETIGSLVADITNNRLVDSSETYIKIVMDEDGEIEMEQSTYQEYLRDTCSRVYNTDSSSGWMRFHTSVFEVNSTTGQASCAFTWLTPPSPRMRDVVGLSLRNGTVNMNTSNGFYTHTSPNTNYNYTFTSSDIRETGGGVTAKFNLRISDYVNDTYDYAFIRTNFTKSGTAEGVNGSYGHQAIGISFNPVFEISRSGVLSLTGGFNIFTYYRQDTGYVSINW